MNDRYLFPLPLEGAGTAEVESFASYFARLAYCHGVSRVQLFRLLCARFNLPNGPRTSLSESTMFAASGVGLHGFSERVETYVDLVQRAVGTQNIRRSTLLPVRHSLSTKAQVGARKGRAWCLACFEDDRAAGREVYDRLLWTLTPVTRCPDHCLQLTSDCPHCGQPQIYQHRTGDVRLCCRCHKSLCSAPTQRIPALRPALGERECVDLVSAISAGRLDATERDALMRFEQELVRSLSPLRKVVRRIATKSNRLNRSGKCVRPRLSTLIRKAVATGSSIESILLDPEGSARRAAQLELEAAGVSKRLRGLTRATAVTLIRKEFERHLAKEDIDDMPSGSEILASYDAPREFGSREFPDLMRVYGRKRVSLIRKQEHKRRAAAVELLQELHKSSQILQLTEEQVISMLVEKSGCWLWHAQCMVIGRKRSMLLRSGM